MACQRDEMTIRIADVCMQVVRSSTLRVPSEITVVIPHAEIRRRFDMHGRMIEEEMILDSLTIVDSPRHEAAGGRLPPQSVPRAAWRFIPSGRPGSPGKNEWSRSCSLNQARSGDRDDR